MTTLTIGFDVPFDEAVKAAAIKGVVLPDVYYGTLAGVARQLAFSIQGITVYRQLEGVRDSLTKAMAEGLSFKEWKRLAAVESLALPNHRLDNIFRTNLQGNYMRGRWEQFVEHRDTHPMLMYDAINDTRVRPSHLAHDGTIRAVDDPFWDTHSPPLGYRCRCSLISLTRAEAQARTGHNIHGEGTGLLKQPRLGDGSPAEPDEGWDYHPFQDRLDEMRRMLAQFNIKQPKPWADEVREVQDRRLAYHASMQGISPQDLADRLNAQVAQAMEDKSVWITTDITSIDSHGMGTDLLHSGKLPKGRDSLCEQIIDMQTIMRYDFEQRVFGESVTGRGMSYGFLSNSEYGPLGGDSFSKVAIKLKHEAKKRTQVAMGKEMYVMSASDGISPSPMLKPDWRSLRIAGRPGGIPDLKELDNTPMAWSAFIKGDVAITDIEEIVFAKQPSPRTAKSLARAGVRWRVAPPDYSPYADFDDPIPFHADHRPG